MSQFEYLSVLVSIIIGLGMSHLLASAARLIQLRRRVRLHAPTLAMMALLFLLQIQIWWAAFDRREDTEWNFYSFLLYLLMPVLSALLCYLVVPDLDDEDEIDMRESHRQNRGWLFGLFALLPIISLLEEASRARSAGEPFPIDNDAIFRVGFMALAVFAAVTKRERWHAAVAYALLIVFVAYVSMLFVQLI